MTCFWDGILQSLNDQDFYKICNNSSRPYHAIEFVEWLKKHNKYTENVEWNDEFLTQKQLEENFKSIEELDKNTIGNGYNCSSFDPFLFLICELFKLKIIHNLNGVIMLYCHKTPIKVVKYKSDLGHFMNI